MRGGEHENTEMSAAAGRDAGRDQAAHARAARTRSDGGTAP